jgi:hypothetical protein
VCDLFKNDRKLTIHEMAEEMGIFYDSYQAIFTQDLLMLVLMCFFGSIYSLLVYGFLDG